MDFASRSEEAVEPVAKSLVAAEHDFCWFAGKHPIRTLRRSSQHTCEGMGCSVSRRMSFAAVFGQSQSTSLHPQKSWAGWHQWVSCEHWLIFQGLQTWTFALPMHSSGRVSVYEFLQHTARRPGHPWAEVGEGEL